MIPWNPPPNPSKEMNPCGRTLPSSWIAALAVPILSFRPIPHGHTHSHGRRDSTRESAPPASPGWPSRGWARSTRTSSSTSWPGPDDVKGPKALHPAFYGSYDWHSSVHGHWMLARLLRRFPDLPEAGGDPRRPRGAPDGREPQGRGRLLRAARRASRSSGPTAGPGCSSSPRSCTAGTTPTPGTGRRTSGRWRT